MEEKLIEKSKIEFRVNRNYKKAKAFLFIAKQIKPNSIRILKLNYVVNRQLNNEAGAISDCKKIKRIEKASEYFKKGKGNFTLKHLISN